MTKGVLAQWDKKNESVDYYHWGIALKEIGEIIGTGGSLGINERNQSTELNYCMGRAYWAKGHKSEAVAAMIEYLFDTLKNACRLRALVFTTNLFQIIVPNNILNAKPLKAKLHDMAKSLNPVLAYFLFPQHELGIYKHIGHKNRPKTVGSRVWIRVGNELLRHTPLDNVCQRPSMAGAVIKIDASSYIPIDIDTVSYLILLFGVVPRFVTPPARL